MSFVSAMNYIYNIVYTVPIFGVFPIIQMKFWILCHPIYKIGNLSMLHTILLFLCCIDPRSIVLNRTSQPHQKPPSSNLLLAKGLVSESYFWPYYLCANIVKLKKIWITDVKFSCKVYVNKFNTHFNFCLQIERRLKKLINQILISSLTLYKFPQR